MSAQQQGGTQTGTQQASGGAGRYPFRQGIVAGLFAFVVGYGITFLTLLVDIEVSGGTAEVDDWQEFGLVFYNAQFVRLDSGAEQTINQLGILAQQPRPDASVGLTDPGVFEFGLLTLPVIFYTALVGLVLVGAGFLVATRATTQRSSVTDRMEAGMTVTLGYLPLIFLGSFLFESEIALLDETFNPDVFASVLVAGIVFPLVFGAIGGYLAGR